MCFISFGGAKASASLTRETLKSNHVCQHRLSCSVASDGCVLTCTEEDSPP